MTREDFGDKRPAPIRLHDGSVVVPGVLCRELAAALDLLDAFVRNTPPPAACRPGKLSRAALAVRIAAHDGAAEYQRQQPVPVAAARPSRTTFLPPAQTPAGSVPEITTEQAATITGLTEQRIRQLAAAGTINGRKTDRAVWLLDPVSVRAYRDRRSTRHDHSGTGHHRPAERGAA